jgi:hypothetical protein
MNSLKKSQSGDGFHLPENIAKVLSLRVGISRNTIPDEVLHTVNSIKVRINPDGWKKVSGYKPVNSWRGSGGGTPTSGLSSNVSNGGFRITSSSSQTSLHSPQQQQQQQHNTTHKKYTSKFKNAETEEVDDKIMNTIINGKLNKFSPANYDEIKGFLQQILESGETDFIKDFMLLVFKKAASEEIFCTHYARLVAELSTSYTSLKTEMKTLQGKFLEIFEEIDESDAKNYKSFLERNKEKIYRLGYSQFLCELANREVLEADTIVQTFQTLIGQIKIHSLTVDKNKLIEEYCDCMLRMAKVFKNISPGKTYIINLKRKVFLCAILLNTILNGRHSYRMHSDLFQRRCV